MENDKYEAAKSEMDETPKQIEASDRATRTPRYRQKSDKSGFLVGFVAGILIISIIVMMMSTFFPSYLADSFNRLANKTAVDKPSQEEKDEINKKVDYIFSLLDKYYVNEYDRQEMINTMYQALVYAVGDPYTTYYTADELTKFFEETEGIYAGIGVSVTVNQDDNTIMIVTPFEGYPGEKAGMLPGDKILKVNDTDVAGDSLDYAISMMKGEPGTSVNITLYRESSKTTFTAEVVRETINVPTVSHKMLEGDMGYLRITQFDGVTYDQFMLAYNDLKADGMKGMIIDLRNNPGGLLHIVTKIADVLVPEGTIVYTEDKNGKQQFTKSDANCIDVPLVVLINGYSASASEVLSGAIKDMEMGELVGTTTFGKALVQNIYPIYDGSGVKITIAKYYTPNGILIQGEGIKPDHEIDMDTELSVKISSLTMEEDIQLQEAVRVLGEKMK